MSRSPRLIATAVVAAAAVAPAAQAMPRIVDGGDATPSSAVYVHAPGADAAAYSRAIRVFENEELGTGQKTQTATPAAVRTTAFDWGDAGIGAATGSSVVLLLGTALFVVGRRSGGRRLAL